ncbi:MAG TPA: ATP-binding cassette domain-containing protein [Solirubrobacteraceae bacterium]|nr:ATP-binding cassette domain-containing protein [Solirubrobacteraceae bacterium]
MNLLVLEGVSKTYGRGHGEQVALCEVSLDIGAGEMVTVYGRRQSGRSTLLRVAAGLERPDCGVVRLDGRDLAERASAGLAGRIGYCQRSLGSPEGETALEQVALAVLARGVARSAARSRSRAVLERVGCASLLTAPPGELNASERMRVAIARALASEPRLLVADEPTIGVDLLDRDAILLLLRSLADEGIAVLTSAADSTGFLGADRALSLSDGRLHGQLRPEIAPVIPLRRAASW